jgi:hypothetical protein
LLLGTNASRDRQFRSDNDFPVQKSFHKFAVVIWLTDAAGNLEEEQEIVLSDAFELWIF